MEGGTYQQVVSVSVGAIGESTRLFVIEFTPSGGVRAVGITAIRVVEGEVGGSTTDIGSEELGGTILVLSSQVDEVLAETGILLLELPNTVQRTHLVIGEVHGCLEPGDCLFELGGGGVMSKRMQMRKRSDGEWCTCST